MMDQRCWDLAKHYIDDNSSGDDKLDRKRTDELGQEIQDIIDEYLETLDKLNRFINKGKC